MPLQPSAWGNMPDSELDIVKIPGVGEVSVPDLWEKIGPQVLTVTGEESGPVVKAILESGKLTIEEQVLLILVAVESLSSTVLMIGDLPHER